MEVFASIMNGHNYLALSSQGLRALADVNGELPISLLFLLEFSALHRIVMHSG